MWRNSVVIASLPFALMACQTNETLSVKDALKLTAEVQKQEFTPPPRSIIDITKIFDESAGVDLTSIERLRGRADAQVPGGGTAADLAEFYHNRSNAAFALGRHVQALEDSRKAASFVPAIRKSGARQLSDGRRARIAGYLSRRSRMESIFGNYRQATELIESGLEEALRVRKGRAGQILKFTQDAIRIYSRTGDIKAVETAVEGAQGALNRFSRGRRGAAQRALQAQIYRANWQAQILQQKGQWRDAEPLLRKEVALRQELVDIGVRRGLDFTLSVRGRLTKNLMAQGRLLEAEAEARSSLRMVLAKLGKYSFGTVKYTNILSNVLAGQGRYAEAQKLIQVVFEILSQLRTPEDSSILARARVLSGVLYAAVDDWSSAMRAFDIAKQKLASNRAVYDELVATRTAYHVALIRSGRSIEAIGLIEPLLKKQSARGEKDPRSARRFGALAMAYVETGQQRKALDAFARAVPVLAAESAKQVSGSTLQGKWRLIVLDAYLDFLAGVRETELEASLGKPATSEMFRVAEIVRGGSVQTALSGSAARSAAGNVRLADIVRREQDIGIRLDTLLETVNRLLSAPRAEQNTRVIERYHEEIDKLRSAQATLRAELADKFPEYANLVRPAALVPAEAAKWLRADEALVAFYVGQKQSFVWAVDAKGETSFARVGIGEVDLGDSVARLRNALDPGAIRYLRDIPRFDLDSAYQLYGKLLEPVEDRWMPAKHLYVVTDGALGQLPISLLPTTPTMERFDEGLLFRHYRSVKWLARTHSVTTLPSVASLQALRATTVTPAGRRPFVGFGDPYFNNQQARQAELATAKMMPTTRGIMVRSAPATRDAGSATLKDLPRLPDTRTELISVAKALKADVGQDVFFGASADEVRVRTMDLSNYAVISFATHGLVPGDLDGLEQPALALSAPEVTGQGGDGLLAMDEVLALELNADWAVLSACNTAAADGQAAEAVSGLGRAFFYAGARSLLVSNWPVLSEATTQLMVRLFERTATLPRAEALRQARVQMIDELVARDGKGRVAYAYSHPIFWAPFVIVGDNGNGKPGA